MDRETIMKKLEAIYTDYFDGLYCTNQLKFMLNMLHKKTDIGIQEWAEMLLDAQWKNATEEDYESKRKELLKVNDKE
ncbi:hypothetical protein [Calidifontibacillus oryziterrae]|uniref:hypothetical protein n=1 Tax=Calidifontibacillus oryziterrae TaxID=1191699 RepID=UPI00030A7E64|nr:hypothetical protein [Calidifontibacillus oryziterrae]